MTQTLSDDVECLLLSFIVEEDSVGTNLLLVLYCVKCNYPLHLNPYIQQSHHQVCGMCLLLSPEPWGWASSYYPVVYSAAMRSLHSVTS